MSLYVKRNAITVLEPTRVNVEVATLSVQTKETA